MTFDGDNPIEEWATSITYPPGHASDWSNETMLMLASSEALARRRADIHREHGAETQVRRRMWTPGEWEAA